MKLNKSLITSAAAASILLSQSALALPLYSITDLGTLGSVTSNKSHTDQKATDNKEKHKNA
jgi:hypothetical protein